MGSLSKPNLNLAEHHLSTVRRFSSDLLNLLEPYFAFSLILFLDGGATPIMDEDLGDQAPEVENAVPGLPKIVEIAGGSAVKKRVVVDTSSSSSDSSSSSGPD